MIKSLDLKDRRLLYELDLNSRLPISDIAKKIRLNKNTTNFRLNRLIRDSFIIGFYPVIDISKFEYFSIRIYFNFFNTRPEKEQEIFQFLTKHPSVVVVAELETIYDVMFSVVGKDIYEFENFWNEFKLKFRKSFCNEKINIFTKVVHLKRKYLALKKESISYEEEIIGGNEKVPYDKLDLKILSILVKNCRISALEISEILNVPARTIIYRLKQFEKKKIIQGYRINLNLDKLGYGYYKINFQLNSLDKLNELVSFCKNNPYIIFINYTLSDYDFEIDIEIPNKKELNNLIKEIKIKQDIRKFEVLSFKTYHKLESIPKF
jgi:Lrp/AsnC family transcriptional regulator, regulator for asnA, asnC and gidA